jgi:hypothetical protein
MDYQIGQARLLKPSWGERAQHASLSSAEAEIERIGAGFSRPRVFPFSRNNQNQAEPTGLCATQKSHQGTMSGLLRQTMEIEACLRLQKSASQPIRRIAIDSHRLTGKDGFAVRGGPDRRRLHGRRVGFSLSWPRRGVLQPRGVVQHGLEQRALLFA